MTGLPVSTWSISVLWLIDQISRLSLLFGSSFAIEGSQSSKILSNLDLVSESGIAMSMKDHLGADMSDSNIYGKENGTRMRGKKF